jgi:hypothetical protein
MSIWDKVLPHRLLINSSLRKASDALKSDYDEYKADYEQQIEHCSAEIEQARIKKDSNFEEAKLSLIDELSKDADLFEKVQAKLLEYVDLFLRRQCLYKVQEAKKLEKQALYEYAAFLSSQMRLIGEEIDVLEERKDKLAAQAKVEDVKELLGLTGCEIAVSEDDDAVILLAKVSQLVNTIDMSKRLTRQALLKLRSVLQERVDLLPVIQFVSWMIQQKIFLSAQLKLEREKTKTALQGKTVELSDISNSINDLGRLLNEQARTVREYWAVPITHLNVRMSYLRKKKKEVYDEYKTVSERIENIKRSGSSDSSWDSLWNRKKEIRESVIPSLKNEISIVSAELKQWIARRQMLYSLCKKNNVYLISDGKGSASDEYQIIDARLSELYQIESDANQSEEERFKRESAQILLKKKEKVDQLTDLIANAQKHQIEMNANLSRATKTLSNCILYP